MQDGRFTLSSPFLELVMADSDFLFLHFTDIDEYDAYMSLLLLESGLALKPLLLSVSSSFKSWIDHHGLRFTTDDIVFHRHLLCYDDSIYDGDNNTLMADVLRLSQRRVLSWR